MINSSTFVIGTSDLSDHSLRLGSRALADALGITLIQHFSYEEPLKVLRNLGEEKALVCLSGDVAMSMVGGGSWLETLGSWRIPTVLMVEPLFSGHISGSAAAYASLSASLGVPLLGLVQLGDPWEEEIRRLDGLPWSGYIPGSVLNDVEVVSDLNRITDKNLLQVVACLRNRVGAIL